MNASIPPPGQTTGFTAPELGLTPTLIARAIKKNWLVLALAVAVCLASTAAYTARQVKVYEAVATLQLDPQPLRPLGGAIAAIDQGPESYWSNQEYFATQHQVLTSRRVAALAVRKLGLHRDAAFLHNDPPGSTRRMEGEVPIDRAAEALRDRLTVKPIQDSRLAVVRFSDADPDRAQRVLSTVLDAYVDQNLDATLASAGKTAEWLDTQLVKLKNELEAQEMDLHDFKKSKNLLSVSFDDQSNMLRAEIQQLNTAITALKAKQESVSAKLSVLKNINPAEPSEIPNAADVLGANQALATLRSDYVAARSDLNELRAIGKGDNHPEVESARVRLDAARQALLGELVNTRNGVEADLQAVSRELAGVSRLYESAKTQALDLNINELRFSRLRRSKDNTERVYSLVLERSTESDLSKVMPFNNVRVLDRPLRPSSPILPSPSKNMAFGAVFGLLLGFAGAIGRELLDRTVRGTDDAERDLGIPGLGALPDATSAQHGAYYGAYYGQGRRRIRRGPSAEPEPDGPVELLVHSRSKSAVAEAARAVRTNLMFSSPDRPYRTIVITSAGPSDGKTTVATSIAIAMAQSGQSVCLVDCDLRRPRLHKLFGRDLTEGVTTGLLDPGALDGAISSTDIPNLSVLPAGPLPPNPADLVQSEAFGRLIADLRQRFDRVVIDSPPINLVTDPVILSTRVDATILVLRVKRTKRDAARRALRALRDVGATCPGFVLNAASSGEQYDYRVYYATYGADAKTDTKAAS